MLLLNTVHMELSSLADGASHSLLSLGNVAWACCRTHASHATNLNRQAKHLKVGADVEERGSKPTLLHSKTKFPSPQGILSRVNSFDVHVAGGKSRGRKKAAAPHAMLQWDWDGQRDKIARALAVIADIDLWKLFRPRAPDERLLQTWTQSVRCHLYLTWWQLVVEDTCYPATLP